ncbi:chorion peroxidase-like isoform X2 [Babylonia areolata]
MMGTSVFHTLVVTALCVLPVTTGIIFNNHDDDCFIKGLCGSLFDVAGRKEKNITYLTAEMRHPGFSGLMNIERENFTMNTDRTCDIRNYDSKYRTFDGTCNNPFNLGASAKPLARVLDPVYEDGKEVPRMFSKLGHRLPSPRLVSKLVHPDVHSTTRFTIALMQWGQFMDHDIISTPLPVEDTRRTTKCCTDDRTGIRPDADPECFPIMFSTERNFIGNCMEFVRSMAIKDVFGNTEKPRQHMNVVTSFIDGSPIYGSTIERMHEVRDRDGHGYLMKTTTDDHMPSNGMDDCIKEGPDDVCFLAGDERVNELPGLTVLHLTMVRLHNRIAHILRYRRPFHSDEEVFQKARSIVGGVVQKIMYADWLPIVLGEVTMKRYSLAVGPQYDRPHFSSIVDPSAPNSFGAAVFRFGHTLIPRSFPIGGTDHLLRDLFFKPFMVKGQGRVEQIVQTLTAGIDPEHRSQMPDAFIVEEVTNHLFETEEGLGRGFDLIALNLQRARDHGIPPYNDFREHCGLRRILTFDDPALGISQRALAAVYSHPDDIDLFTGSMVEPLVHGGLVGETFSCLMADVFHNLKFGDRFFYETQGEKGSFTDEELAEIRKVTLSQIFCQTTATAKIQVDAFRIPSQNNPYVNCDVLVRHGINLNVFLRNW